MIQTVSLNGYLELVVPMALYFELWLTQFNGYEKLLSFSKYIFLFTIFTPIKKYANLWKLIQTLLNTKMPKPFAYSKKNSNKKWTFAEPLEIP
jgi:hypothetical protein